MDDHIEKLDKKFHLIQESIKIGNSGNGKTLDHQLSDFINEVKSMPDQIEDIPIKEEKVLLIEVALAQMKGPIGLPPPRPGN